MLDEKGLPVSFDDSECRRVDISDQLASVLQTLRIRQYETSLAAGQPMPEWVFVNSAGGMVDYSRFNKAWKRIFKKAKVTYRKPHNLRHTYASNLLSSGESILYVSKQLGHKSPKTTLDVYSKWIPEERQAPANKLDSIIDSDEVSGGKI